MQIEKKLKNCPDSMSMKNTTLKLLNDAVFETLESRQMMSASATPVAVLSNGVLDVNGDPTAATRVMIDLADNNLVVTVDVMGQRSTDPIGQVKKLDITVGAGSDYIYINPAIDIPAEITTGNGNDTIRSDGGPDTITVGNGNDVVYSKGSHDVVTAGIGNDTILGDHGHDTITAGNGNDSITAGGGDDLITVGSGNDYFLAGDGHDTITTGDGHDDMVGGPSNTYLYGKTASSGSSTSTSKTSGTTGASSTTSTTSTTKSTGGSTTTTTSTSTSSTPSSTGSSSSSGKSASGSTSSGTTSTTTTVSSPSLPTTPVTTTSASAQAPKAVIQLLAGPRFTGLVVNANGLASTVGTGTCITSNYSWDFGDPGTQYNQMTGYNAAHVYDTPGTYTITLTVTNSAGLVSTASQQVTVAAAVRNIIYVDSVNGSDSNNGSENAPLQTLGAAFAQIGDNTEILLRAGESFGTNQSLHVNNTNVLIGRYGTGANPTIERTIGNGTSTIASYGNTNGMTIQDITFDSPYPSTSTSAKKIGVGGVFLGGQNLCVRDCTFLNIDDAMNENGNPTGVLLQSNTAPLAVGLRGYMVWGQGSEEVIIGNYAANTTVEHIVRLVGLDEVTVEDNNFTNHDGKGCIEMHEGEYGWIVGNTCDGGDIRLGPLGLWGESASSNTSWCVVEDNQLTDTFLFVQSGTEHAMIANNTITTSGGQAIYVSGVDSQGRTSTDISFINNTAVDTGTQGNFIEVGGWVNGIVMQDNLFIAPSLRLGSYGSAPVYVNADNLSCFTLITGNVWPDPVSIGTYAQGGINFVGTQMLSSNYLTAAQWNSQSQVGSDYFQNVVLGDSYQISLSGDLAGAAIKMAA